MFERTQLKLLSSPIFWRLKKNASRIRYEIAKAGFEAGNYFTNTRSRISLVRQFVFITIRSLLPVAAALVVLESLEPLLANVNIFIHISTLLSADGHSNYNDLLQLYAQILAVIISIYFATLGIIMGSAHHKLRRDLLNLIIREQISSVYSRFLVFSATFCLLATSLTIFGYQTGILVFVFGAVVSFTSVLVLFPLGIRLFNFFDLFPMIDQEIIPNILKNIKFASSSQKSIHLQNHAYKQVQIKLEQLHYICKGFQSKSEDNTENVIKLCSRYSDVLIYYSTRRKLIDEQSYWFPRKQKYASWFLTSDSSTSMALETYSHLIPVEEADLTWFETEIHSNLHHALETALGEEKIDMAIALLQQTSQRLDAYAKNIEFSTASNEIKFVNECIKQFIGSRKAANPDESLLSLLSLFDVHAATVQGFCLELFKSIIKLDKPLRNFIHQDQWSLKNSRELPSFLQNKIKTFENQIQFEVDTDGQRLSQPKYLTQLLIKSVLEYYYEIFESTIALHEAEMLDIIEQLGKSNLTEAAIQQTLRSLNMNWQFSKWLPKLQEIILNYQAYQHYKEDEFTFPEINFTDLEKRLTTTKNKLVSVLADKNIQKDLYQKIKHDPNFPDHYGNIYYLLANECFNALDQNDYSSFKTLYNAFFPLAHYTSIIKIPSIAHNHNVELKIGLMSSTITDITSLIGYSIIYSHYHDNFDFQTLTLETWRSFYAKQPNKKEYINGMFDLHKHSSTSMIMLPRTTIRTSWKIQFDQRAREDGYSGQMGYNGPSNEHPNPVVRAFLDLPSDDPSDVFFAHEALDDLNHKKNSYVMHNLQHLAEKMKFIDEADDED